MSQFKYAFLLNSETLTPENYYGAFETDDFQVNIYGVNSMDLACETAKKIVESGVELIDLCGDFDEEKSNQIKAYTGQEFDIAYAKYSDEEMAKFNALENIQTYGIIIMVEGFEPTSHRLELKSDELNTTVVGVNDMDQACEQAKKFADLGIDFIELCSAFDEEKANAIVDAVEGRIPVGYAG